MRANLAQGTHARRELQLPEGLASVDHRQHAALEQSADGLTLHVRDLLSAETVHRWPLPALAVDIGEARWGSRLLAAPYSDAEDDHEETGLLLVDVASGTCYTHVLLPADSARLPLLCGWSAADLLLVDHTSEAREDSASVFDVSGRLVDCALMPRAQGFIIEYNTGHCCWALDGHTAVLTVWLASLFYVWDVGVSQPVCHDLGRSFRIGICAWLHDSCRLLFLGDGGEVLIWSPNGSTVLHPGDFEWPPLVGSKGRIALLQRPPPEVGVAEAWSFHLNELVFYTVQDSTLSPGPALHKELPVVYVLPHLPAQTPDRAFAAVCTGHSTESTSHSGGGLDIVSLDGALQHHLPLPFPVSSNTSVQWASAGDAVLVSDWISGKHVLLEYA